MPAIADGKLVKVKLKTARAGHRVNESGEFIGAFSQEPGEIVEMSKEEAERNIAAGFAVAVPA